MKIALIQLSPTSDHAHNISQAEAFIAQAVSEEKPDWILLPETFSWIGGTQREKFQAAEHFPDGPVYRAMQACAAKYQIFIHAGSIMEYSNVPDRLYNTSVVFNRSGEEIARYRKIHLFDVSVPNPSGEKKYYESEWVQAGTEIVAYEVEGFRIGCAICYDLRFPALFQALIAKGVHMIALPAAFTLETGKDHWEVLCRARAIETQTYFCAAAQIGSFQSGATLYQTYGHSIVVDPWGHVICRASDGPGIIYARLDLERVHRIRQQIPLVQHRKIFKGLSEGREVY